MAASTTYAYKNFSAAGEHLTSGLTDGLGTTLYDLYRDSFVYNAAKNSIVINTLRVDYRNASDDSTTATIKYLTDAYKLLFCSFTTGGIVNVNESTKLSDAITKLSLKFWQPIETTDLNVATLVGGPIPEETINSMFNFVSGINTGLMLEYTPTSGADRYVFKQLYGEPPKWTYNSNQTGRRAYAQFTTGLPHPAYSGTSTGTSYESNNFITSSISDTVLGFFGVAIEGIKANTPIKIYPIVYLGDCGTLTVSDTRYSKIQLENSSNYAVVTMNRPTIVTNASITVSNASSINQDTYGTIPSGWVGEFSTDETDNTVKIVIAGS